MGNSVKEKDLPSPGGTGESAAADSSRGSAVLTKDGFEVHPQPVPDDQLDPLNWSAVQKHCILAIVMALYFMFTFITTVTVPTFGDLQDQYGASVEEINWTLAVPALGLALGPLFWSSIADIVGRRVIFIAGTTMALAATVGAAKADQYGGYMAARFFQGFGASPAATVGLAIINDMFFEHERGQKVGLWTLAIDLGALFGPLIGGFVALVDHIWIQWVSAIMFAAILAAEVLFLPETLYPRDLMLAGRPGDGASAAAADNEKGLQGPEVTSPDALSEVRRTKKLAYVNVLPVPGMRHPKPWDSLVRFALLFKYATVSLAVFIYCFGWYWWLISIITMVPVAYADYSAQTQGLFFVGLIIGTLVSEVFFSGRLSDWIVLKLAKRNGGMRTPEMRLWLAYPAALFTAIGLILWGISIDQGYHWIVGQVAFVFFGAGIQMGNTSTASYIVDCYPLQSMSIVVFYSVLLNFSAFVDPFFILPWVESSGYTWCFAAQGIITAGFCIPALALIHKFGPRIRESTGTPGWVNPEYDHQHA